MASDDVVRRRARRSAPPRGLLSWRDRRRQAEIAALARDYEDPVRDRLYGGPPPPAISDVRRTPSRPPGR